MHGNLRAIGHLVRLCLLVVMLATVVACGSAGQQSSGAASGSPQAAPPKASSPAASSQASPSPAAAPVRLGVIGAQTGPMASLGQPALRGVQDAVGDIADRGGIKSLGGANIEVVVADHQGKTELALSETQRLIEQEKVDLLMGALLSGPTLPSTQAAEERRVPMVVPLGVADAITERGFKYTFRYTAKQAWGAATRVTQVEYVADVAGKRLGRKLSKVALLFEDTDFGQSSAKSTGPELKKKGFDLVAEVAYPANSTDVSAYVSRLKAAAPDIILQFGYTADAILFTRTMDRLALKAEVIGTAGHVDPQWLSNVGPLGENVWVSHLWNYDLKLPGLGQGVTALADRYQQRYGQPADPHWAIYYQGVWLIKEALEKAGSRDKEAIRSALASLEYTGPVWTLPYNGKVTFGPDGQTPESLIIPVILMQVQEGKLKTIWPEQFAAAKGR